MKYSYNKYSETQTSINCMYEKNVKICGPSMPTFIAFLKKVSTFQLCQISYLHVVLVS